MLKMQDLTIFLRYKKSEVNIIKDILLNTFSENNDYYIPVSYTHLKSFKYPVISIIAIIKRTVDPAYCSC